MALTPDDCPTDDRIFTPLTTGFTYTPRSELENFELPPDVAGDLARRLEAINTYHRGTAARVASSDIVLR